MEIRLSTWLNCAHASTLLVRWPLKYPLLFGRTPTPRDWVKAAQFRVTRGPPLTVEADIVSTLSILSGSVLHESDEFPLSESCFGIETVEHVPYRCSPLQSVYSAQSLIPTLRYRTLKTWRQPYLILGFLPSVQTLPPNPSPAFFSRLNRGTCFNNQILFILRDHELVPPCFNLQFPLFTFHSPLSPFRSSAHIGSNRLAMETSWRTSLFCSLD